MSQWPLLFRFSVDLVCVSWCRTTFQSLFPDCSDLVLIRSRFEVSLTNWSRFIIGLSLVYYLITWLHYRHYVVLCLVLLLCCVRFTGADGAPAGLFDFEVYKRSGTLDTAFQFRVNSFWWGVQSLRVKSYRGVVSSFSRIVENVISYHTHCIMRIATTVWSEITQFISTMAVRSEWWWILLSHNSPWYKSFVQQPLAFTPLRTNRCKKLG